jgi:hypothetical protein
MRAYVDRECGLVSREIFVDEEVYRLEQDRIFCKRHQVNRPGERPARIASETAATSFPT